MEPYHWGKAITATVCVLISALCSVEAATCAAGTPLFVLIAVAGGSTCDSSEVAVVWSRLSLRVDSNCNYKVNMTAAYSYPTSFAKVTYPGPAGVSGYSSQLVKASPFEPDNSYYIHEGTQPVTKYYEPDFKGFTNMLSHAVFPPYWAGPFGPDTNTPANYTFKLQGPSSFAVISPPNSCTFTYAMINGPPFGAMKPSTCTPGKDPNCPSECPSGRYKQPLQGSSGHLCALCPAGTYSTSSSSSRSCTPCAGATVARAVGATSCQTCPAPYQPSPTRTACITCPDSDYNLPRDAIYTPACVPESCPKGSISTTNQQCISAEAGQLCVVRSTISSSSPKCGPATAASSAAAPTGGAILTLVGSDTSKPGCSSWVRPLARWLEGKLTFMGFNLTSASWASNEGPEGVQWQVLGSLKDSNLRPWPICGNAHGGPGPQPGLTVEGKVLGTKALTFISMLSEAPNTDRWSGSAWRVLAAAGPTPGTVETTWFRDVGAATCGTTSLNARSAAGGPNAEDTCKITFKVVAGSILGVPGGGPCPPGAITVKLPGSSTSCMACARGYAATDNTCRPCTDKSYTDQWGSTSCKPCSNSYPNYGGSPNTYCYGSNE